MAEQYVKESPKDQGAGEKKRYKLTVTPWDSSPSNESLAVYQEGNPDVDVTSDVTSGSKSTSGDVVTWPFIESLTKGLVYRAELTFDAGGNTHVAKLELHAT